MSRDIDERVNRGQIAALIALGAMGGIRELARERNVRKVPEIADEPKEVDAERKARVLRVKTKAAERRQQRMVKRLRKRVS